MSEKKNLFEDSAFSNFLKTNLEKDCAVSPSTLSAILSVAQIDARQQKHTLFYGPWLKVASLLTAACLLLICGIGLFAWPEGKTPRRRAAIADARADDQIVQLIELLNETGDFSLEQSGSMDTIDLLLAWQDAPYKHLENEFVNQLSF